MEMDEMHNCKRFLRKNDYYLN